MPILLSQVLWFVMAFGAQLTYPILSLEMIDMHPQARGAAASVQSFIALGVGAVVMGVVAPLLHGRPGLSVDDLAGRVAGGLDHLARRRFPAPPQRAVGVPRRASASSAMWARNFDSSTMLDMCFSHSGQAAFFELSAGAERRPA